MEEVVGCSESYGYGGVSMVWSSLRENRISFVVVVVGSDGGFPTFTRSRFSTAVMADATTRAQHLGFILDNFT